MNRFYSVLLTFFLVFTASIKAQNVPQTLNSGKYPIEYQFPKNAETEVQEQTTLIVRLSKIFMQGHSASDFSFSVTGEISGIHKGKVLISDNNQTILFKPEQPFARNENVSVRFEIFGTENFTPFIYSFHITSMSEVERRKALYEFYLSEQEQNDKYYEESLKHTPPQAMTSAVSITGLPLDATIDTLGNHAPGNIYFSVTTKFPKPTSFIATINDTGVLFTRNIPDEVPIPTGKACGNFHPLSNNTFTYFRQDSSPTGGVFFGRHEILNKNGNLIDFFECGNGQIADLHDFHLMPNGHAILVAYSPRRENMRTVLNDSSANPNALVYDGVIQELDNSKNVIMEWNSKNHFLITDATSDINLHDTSAKAKIDYCHINTAVIDSSDGNMMASFRHLDEVTKINWKTSELIWRWGGKHNMFTFEGDTLKFSHQHDPARIINGHITMWDNGNLRLKDTVVNGKDTVVNHPFSRAVEYQLDEITHTAKTVWQYRKVPFSPAAGNLQTLQNGNRLIGTGSLGAPAAIELDGQTDEVVYQLSVVTNAFVYRTYRFETPAISSVKQTGTAHSFDIGSIYPNPAQSVTTITFSVAETGFMEIDLLDILGHQVRIIQEKLSEPGTYSADFDVHDLSPGTYYCKLSQDGNTKIKMMVIQR